MTHKKYTLPLVLTLLAAPALAHEGHGLFGSHWHATDTLGLLLVAGAAGLAWWFARGGK